MPYRIVFFGTPDIGVPTLEALAADPRFHVTLCVTQPDRPQGRKHELLPTPVKAAALKLGIPVLQPEKLATEEVYARLRQEEADFFVVIAYGKIMRQEVLDMPKIAPINIHGSLLPRHRGASPIQSTLLAGDTEAGITIMRMTAGMDEGPMIALFPQAITSRTTSGQLFRDISTLAAKVFPDTLVAYAEGKLTEVPQENSLATTCTKLTKEMGHLHFAEQSAAEIHRLWQALTPWPGIFCFLQGKRVKLLRVEALEHSSLAPGAMSIQSSDMLIVGTKTTDLAVYELQPEGKKSMSGSAFYQGVRVHQFDL